MIDMSKMPEQHYVKNLLDYNMYMRMHNTQSRRKLNYIRILILKTKLY